MQGLTVPNDKMTGLESPQNPSLVAPAGCKNDILETKQKRETLYIYVEIQGGNYTRIGKVSNQYRPNLFGNHERMRDKTLEAAVEIACAELCRLHNQNQRGNVIISSMENADKARKDPGRLIYSWRAK